MTIHQPISSPVLANVLRLVDEIAAAAPRIDAERAIPRDLAEKLKGAGVFRMIVPRAHGGEEMHPVAVAEVLEALARADGSTAWNVMVAQGHTVTLGRLPRETTQAVYADGPDVMVRYSLVPRGTARPVEGGYLVQGRWSMASGCFDPQWVLAHCVVNDEAGPRLDPATGLPVSFLALVPGEAARFIDTWDVVGMRGTESHDFVIEERFVPQAHTASMMGPSCFESPLHRQTFFMIASPPHAAVAVGIAQGALDDLAALSRSKRPAMKAGQLLGEHPVFNQRLGELAVQLRAARAFLHAELETAWQASAAGRSPTPMEAMEVASMTSFVQHACQKIVDEAMLLAGATVCYNTSTLQRRWRDLRCLMQHVSATRDAHANLGAALLAQAD